MTRSRSDDDTPRFLRIPYDFRRPSVARLRQRWWNADDPRVIVPKAWGWGWDVNLRAIPNKLRPKQ